LTATINIRGRSPFAQKFHHVYGGVRLPSVYREFIESDAYLPYRRSFVQGLFTYDPTEYVELNLADSMLLKRDELFDDSDIDPDDATEFHPMALLRDSPQFLAIKSTVKTAPVFLWHHETGAFHPQYSSFARFLRQLRTPKEAREEHAKAQRAFSSIRKECGPALERSRSLFEAGDLNGAAALLDAVLHDRGPIAYDGGNDFDAIGILCACFNLRGRILLAEDRLSAARAAFLDAMACGGTPYWEALVDAVVTSFLLEDVEPVVAEVSGIDPVHFQQPPGPILMRNFTAQQIDRLIQVAKSPGLSEAQRGVAKRVLDWVFSVRGRKTS